MRKKISFLVSLLMAAAILLTACSSGNTSGNNNENPGAAGTAALGTPGAEGNGTPASNGAAGSGMVTPAAGIATQTAAPGAGGVVPSGTLSAGTPATGATATNGPAAVVPSGTLSAGTPEAGGTPAAGAPVTTGTAAASLPVTSGNICQYNRLTKFTGMKVVDTQNQEVGTVKDVVVVRDTSVFQTSMNTNNNASGNNASANGQANGNGTANNPGNNASANGQANGTGANQGGVVMSSGQALAPMINYVVVDLAQTFGGKTILVPFPSFKFNAAQAAGTTAAAQVTTPAAGAANGTPVATVVANGGNANNGTANNSAANDCVATLNVQPQAFNNIPIFDASKVDFTAANWDQPYRSFWASQGGTIPATGSNKYGMPMLLSNQISDVHVKNANGDDLGEVKDFIIDPASGRFSYAALGTGGFLGIGQKMILIPLTAMNWVSNGQNNQADHGYLSLNLTKEQVQAAPTVDNLDQVDFSAANWDQALMNYWKAFGASTSPTQQVATPGAPPSK